MSHFRKLLVVLVFPLFPVASFGQQAFTWEQVRDKFEAVNPTLKAAQINIDESRANETTAYLRPNPEFNFATDGTQLVPHSGVWQPLLGTQYQPGVSYLHERQHKRELRLEAAKKATDIAGSQFNDQDRTLLGTLRTAFVLTLQQKALLALAQAEPRLLRQSTHHQPGAIPRGGHRENRSGRLELQRVQYESDLESARVALEDAKIQVLQLLNDRTPPKQFDVTGPFDSSDQLPTPDELHSMALDTRPDLKAAVQAVEMAKTNHKLAVSNGSTDPTVQRLVFL